MKKNETKYIAAISIVLILLLLCLRIWASDVAVSFVGPTQIRMGQNGTVYTVSDNILYLHDKDGDLVDVVPLNKFGVEQFIGDFWIYKNGDILIRREVSQKLSAGRELEMYARLGSGEWDGLKDGESILQRCSMDSFACAKFGEGGETFGKITTFKLFVDEDRGHTYVADTLGHQLLGLDDHGVVSQRSHAIFKFPNQIVLENDGLLYVADTNHHRIAGVRTDADNFGIIKHEFRISGDNLIAGCVWPMSLARTPDNRWWVINAGNDMRNGDLVIYDNEGTVIKRVDLPDDADPMSLLALQDKVLVTDPSLMRIYTIGLDGRLLDDFGSTTFKLDASALLRNKRWHEGLSSLSLALMLALLVLALIMAWVSRQEEALPLQGKHAQPMPARAFMTGGQPRKFDYHATLNLYPAMIVAVVLLLTIIYLMLKNVMPESQSVQRAMIKALFLAPTVLIGVYYQLKNSYVEISDQGLVSMFGKKQVSAAWHQVREIIVRGKTNYKIVTDQGSFIIGRVEPADKPTQTWTKQLFSEMGGKNKDALLYAGEIVADIRHRAPQAKLTYSFLSKLSGTPVMPPARVVSPPGPSAPTVVRSRVMTAPPAPQAQAKPVKRTGIMAVLAAIGAILLKFKGLLVLLLTKLKPLLMALKFMKAGVVLKTGLSMIVSMWAYALAWGWVFAAGFVLLLFVHEMGHAVALRHFGIKTGAPIFIPFVGAFIAMKEMPKDARMEAWTGIAGPLLGTVGALFCWAVAMNTGSDLWRALAYTGFFLNLFNLIPLSPLDGGRTVAAISPKLWIIGFIGVLLLFLRSFNPLLLLILIPAGKNVAMLWKKKDEKHEQYYGVDLKTKIQMSLLYFGLIGFLVMAMALTHVKR